MAELQLRVIVLETRTIAPFYGKFLSAKKNGNKSVAAFWALFRYQFRTGELDPYLNRAFRQLHVHSMQTPDTLLSTPLRIDFACDDTVLIEKYRRWGAHYTLSKADTIKLLLIASDMLDAQQSFVETLIYAPATQPHGAGTKSTTIPVSTVEAVPRDLPSPAACAISSSSSISSMALEPSVQPLTERTRFCNDTNAWQMFKPLRANSAMTANQLSDINLFGGSFVAMTDQELIQRSLTNPVVAEVAISKAAEFAVSNEIQSDSAPKQQEISKAAQIKLANSMFAAANFMIKDSE